jgi:hypothetical protein
MQVYEQVTVSTTSKALTEAAYKPRSTTKAQKAIIGIEDNGIRFRLDGLAPTSAVGMEAGSGDMIELNGIDEIVQFRAIRSGAADAVLNVTYSFGV